MICPQSPVWLYLSAPQPLYAPGKTAVLDTILWQAKSVGVMVIGWANIDSPTDVVRQHRDPISLGLIKWGQPVSSFFTANDNASSANGALAQALSALRIMQQPYAAQTSEQAPQAVARRFADATPSPTSR